MQIENKKSEVNNFIGIKTKEDFNYPLTFIILGILTKNYFKYNCYSEFTHRDIANKVNNLFENDIFPPLFLTFKSQFFMRKIELPQRLDSPLRITAH